VGVKGLTWIFLLMTWPKLPASLPFSHTLLHILRYSLPILSSQYLCWASVDLCYGRYFNDRLSVLMEFLPQVIFLLSIFGYLILLIVYKWLAYDSSMSSCAPSLLIGELLIQLCASPLQCLSVCLFHTSEWVDSQRHINTIRLYMPFTLVHAGKYSTEDKLIQTIQKLSTTFFAKRCKTKCTEVCAGMSPCCTASPVFH